MNILKSPITNCLESKIMEVNNYDGEQITKTIFIDDQGNLVNNNDIQHINEIYKDEYGNTKLRVKSTIKDQSFKKMHDESNK